VAISRSRPAMVGPIGVDLDDADLLDAVIAGNVGALGALYDRYGGPADWGDPYSKVTPVQMRVALGELPSEQRDAIELAFFGGLTTEEGAQRLGIPPGIFRERMHVSIQSLKSRLDEGRPHS